MVYFIITPRPSRYFVVPIYHRPGNIIWSTALTSTINLIRQTQPILPQEALRQVFVPLIFVIMPGMQTVLDGEAPPRQGRSELVGGFGISIYFPR